MALFRRKTQDSVLPEVDQYYEAERRDRSGLAWLLALVSITVVALLVVGLFLGGRWVYRTAFDNDDEVAVQEDGQNGEAPSIDGAPADNGEGNEEQPAEEAPAEDGEPAGEEAPAGDEENADETSGDTEEIPNTGDESGNDEELALDEEAGELPSTGPADVVGIFAGVSAIAGGTHLALQRRKK